MEAISKRSDNASLVRLPGPMPVCRLPNRTRGVTRPGDQVPHLRETERGVQRIRKHLALMGVGAAGISCDQVGERLLIGRPKQITNEEQPAWFENAAHLPQSVQRLGNMMHDAVRNDGGESGIGMRQVLGIAACQLQTAGENCLACLEAGLSCNPLGFNQFRLADGLFKVWLATRALLL